MNSMKPRVLIVLLVAASVIAPAAQGLMAFCLTGHCPMAQETQEALAPQAVEVEQVATAEHCATTQASTEMTMGPAAEGCCHPEEQLPARVLTAMDSGSESLECCLVSSENNSESEQAVVLRQTAEALTVNSLEGQPQRLILVRTTPPDRLLHTSPRALFTLHSSLLL
jgi:hypothetical protein